MLGHSEPRRPHACHQHLAPIIRLCRKLHGAQGIPAGQQIIQLNPPGKVEDIRQNAGFNLRNVDRVLLLVHTGFHAVIADAMAGSGNHGIIDHGHGQCRQIQSVPFENLHFRNFFFEGTARQGHAQRINLQAQFRHPFFLGESPGAKIAIMIMTIQTIMDFTLHAARVHAQIRQMKAVAATQGTVGRYKWRTGHLIELFEWHEGLMIYALGQTEARPPRNRQSCLWVLKNQGTPLGQALNLLSMGIFILEPIFTKPGNRPLTIRIGPGALAYLAIQPLIQIRKSLRKFSAITPGATQHKMLFEFHDHIMTAGLCM